MTAAPTAGVTAPSLRIERFFTRHLRHVQGEYAGEPFGLEPWQRNELVVPIFDDLRRDGPRLVRRVREALAGVPKKNGKTTLAAGLAAYGLFHDGYYRLEGGAWRWRQEQGAEVFNVAGGRIKRRCCFGSARAWSSARRCSRSSEDLSGRDREQIDRRRVARARLRRAPRARSEPVDHDHRRALTHRTPELYEAFASAGARGGNRCSS